MRKELIWPAVGLAAVAFSVWLLYHELRGISFEDVVASLDAITPRNWVLAVGATIVAYAALAGYDRIALLHLRKQVPWLFITLCSFTSYAVAHNIGASVLSGAVVRYRAYTSQGLTTAQVAVLVGLCSFTFALGTILLGGIVLVLEPELPARIFEDLPPGFALTLGAGMLAFVLLYVLGSWLHLPPLQIGRFELQYPGLPIVARQLVIGPLELIGAAGIMYFALPAASNPGFVVVLGIFLASFSIALLSHAPGGLGVLEFVFLVGLPDVDPADVVAALLVFRLLYLLIPLALALVVILLFERAQLLKWVMRHRAA